MHRFKLAVCSMVMVAALAPLGCGGDTQEKEPTPVNNGCTSGKNMTAPHLVDGVEPSAGGSLIRISWDKGTEVGAELSSDYFSAAQVSRQTATEVQNLVSSLALTQERELTVRFRNLGPYLTTHNTVEFLLAFPDRRRFSTCTHSGTDDTYLLRVSLNFNDQGQFQSATLTEEVSLGGT
jgi:hypothetical protein